MIPQLKNLEQLVSEIGSRITVRRALRGIALTMTSTALLVVGASMLASRIHGGLWLLSLRAAPFLAAIVTFYFAVWRPLRVKPNRIQLARLVEERTNLSDRLVTAVEYGEDSRRASPAIVERLVKDAATRAASIQPDNVVDPRGAYVSGAAIALILLLALGSLLIGPAGITDGFKSLIGITDGAVSANAMFIAVNPGSTRVPRGSDLKLKATLNGFDANVVQLFVRRMDSENWVARLMEPAKSVGDFQALLFNMQDSMSYYVESNGIRSPEFALEVADLPFVKQIDLLLKFPAYTRLPEKKIENAGEIAALKGTVAHVFAQMSAEAKSARIVLNDGTKIDMVSDGQKQFVGSFTVRQAGTYRIELISEDGQPYNGSNEYDITVLEDHPPTVVIDKPGRDMKVTSIQEVFTQVRAEDDYGVSALELHYSVNGGEERTAKLQDLKSESPKSLVGAQTFFLEEYSLKPGDFISYYATARDNAEGNSRQSTSDIYFLEVRPFDREFRQSQQQGGGQGQEPDSNALTRRQREIIAATFRVQREQESYTRQDKDENFNAVTLSQEKLKTDADALAERIRRRLGEQLQAQSDFAKLVDCIQKATKEMEGAISALHAQNTKEALPPEQRSLQQLLRAEAIFREIQVARGQGQGQGNQNEQQDLADLFELQLDKMKNQYETVQREQQANQSQQEDEIARRLKELAQRQQQQLEQRMRSEMQQGGGGGGSQRQQQEMIDEAQKMARELERLSRDRRDPKLAEAARQMQQAADEMRRAQASQSSRQNSSQQGGASQGGSQNDSAAQQLRALERMEQARRTLESAERAGGQQSLQRLRQQAEDALRRQDEISKSVDDLSGNGRNGQATAQSEQRKAGIAERKQALAEQMSGLERDIDQTARGLGQERQQAADKLREAAGSIRNNRIPDRIRQNQQLIENGWMDQAREREGIIRKNIEQVVKDLQAAEGNAGRRSESESLEDALNKARELADSLDSLRRRIESQRADQGQQQASNGSQQSGQNQSGQQQGGSQAASQQGQRGQQGSNTQQGQAGQRASRQTGRQGRSQQSSGQRGDQARGQQSGQQQGGQQAGGQQQGGQQQGGQQQGAQRQGGQQAGGQQQGGQQQGGQQQGGQQGQQAGGQRAGGQQQGGQQQGGQQQGGQQQGGEQSSRQDESSSMGGGPARSFDRQLESELRQRLAEAEDLKRQLGRNSDLARDLNRAIDQLRRINPNVFSDPSQLALLKNEVIDPLRQLEVELARRLQAKLGNNGGGALSDGDAPDRYRKLIEDYYKRLSAKSRDSKTNQ